MSVHKIPSQSVGWISAEVESYLTPGDKQRFHSINRNEFFITSIPVQLIYDLREINARNFNAPPVFFIRSNHDPSNVLSTHAAHWHIQRFGNQGYRVAYAVLSSGDFIEQETLEMARRMKQLGVLGCIMAHGYEAGIDFAGSHDKNYVESFLDPDCFPGLEPGAPMVLFACLTGLSFAQKMATLTRRTVLASLDVLTAEKSYIHSDNQGVQLIAYNKDDRQCGRIFYPNGSNASPDTSQDRHHFSELERFLQDRSSTHGGAAYELGCFYENQRLYQAAFRAYQTGFGLKNTEAARSLGQCYEQGFYRVVKKDEKKALFYYQWAAERGDLQACLCLGKYLCRVGADPSQAEQWLLRAAAAGNSKAHFELYAYYRDGVGGHRDESQARAFLRSAADLGEPQALFIMGRKHELGNEGFPKDLPTALDYYQRASRVGDRLGTTHYEQLSKTMNSSH